MRGPSDRRTERGHASSTRRRKGAQSPDIPRDEEPKAPPARIERPQPTAAGEERAILVGAGPEAQPEDGSVPALDELAELARTAGARVFARVWQRRDRPEAASYLGSGKLEDLRRLAGELGANLILADTDLTPAQVRHMEEALNLRVVDRSELIIDIFAQHARTRQSALQVELAQLQYQAPRLKRMWTHLSRITGGGGIGSRGPGEKQIEVDRRLIQKRIQQLREELAELEGRRVRQAGSRADTFKVALVGYTNAGKSTLMHALTGADVLIEDKLFATLDTRTRRWELGRELEVLLSDTVGFIEKLPHHLVASFHATLEEVRGADLLLHVVNAGDPEAVRRSQSVREVLRSIGAEFIPEWVVLNKVDLLEPVEASILGGKVQARALVSARTGAGLTDLSRMVREQAATRLEITRLEVPLADGKALALLAARARVLEQHFSDTTCTLTAALPAEVKARLQRYVISED
jgi:GTP-binding protein HflX